MNRKRPTWGTACQAWLADAHRRQLRSVLETEGKLAWITDQWGADKPLATITAASITTLLAVRAETVKGPTANRYYAAVSAVLRAAHRRGDMTTTPLLRRRELYPENTERFRYLTVAEARTLLAELPPHLASMARFALATGLRQANVSGLLWRDVDVARKVAWVWPHQSKNRKRYSVPLNDDAFAVIQSCLGRHHDFVFVYQPEHPAGAPPRPLKQPTGPAWYKATARAGLTGLRWHDLRHTWATWHVTNGTPLEVLQKLGGWSSYGLVLRYAHLAADYTHGYANNTKLPGSFDIITPRHDVQRPAHPAPLSTTVARSETASVA